MAITLTDLPELVRLLEQHPEWREALRLVLLGEELLTMPQLLRQIIETQRQLVEQVAEIVAVQHRHEQQIAELIATQHEILATQHRHEQQIAEIREIQRQLVEQVAEIVAVQHRHEQQVAEIIRVQHRHEQQIAEIIHVQHRHEEQIAELIRVQQQILETQQRHEQQIAELIATQREILAVQQRHEQQIAEIIETQNHHSRLLTEILEVQRRHTEEIHELRTYVGNLAQNLGLNMEEHAEDILLFMIEEKGWRLVQGPYSLSMNGQVDLIAVCEMTPGQQCTVLVEVKLRLGRRQVEGWADKVRSEGFQKRLRQRGFVPPYYPYIFGFRIDVAADRAARQRGMGLLTSRGEMVEPQVIP